MKPCTASFVLLLLAVCLLSERAVAQTNLTVENQTVASGTYTASGTITSGNATVASGSTVTFKAGQSVRLTAGFRVRAGGSFRAVVDPSAFFLTNLPAWTNNSRFGIAPSVPQVKHPSLTLNGFDCGSACVNGYGLKQVIERYAAGDESVVLVYNSLVGQHDDDLSTSLSYGSISENTRILQARAFVALATYILKMDGRDTFAGLPPHADAASRFRQALMFEAGWSPLYDKDRGGWDSAEKWAEQMSNVARALDLYLALENAYCYYGARGDAVSQAECSGTTKTALLSQQEKAAVFAAQHRNIYDMDYKGGPGVTWLPGGSGYDAQTGNWPLRVQAALGAASMVMSSLGRDIITSTEQINRNFSYQSSPALVRRGMNAALRPAGTNSNRYFNYQTSDGKRFWAEGPYYFTNSLETVVPFWHALRTNGMLGYHPDFVAEDPFRTTRFTRPLEWLADLVTPEGFVPPLDDGNKFPIRSGILLRWTSVYGNATVGARHAWINDKLLIAEQPDLLLTALAIPRVPNGQGQAVTYDVGAAQEAYTSLPEQQLIIRRGTSASACNDVNNAGACHYVLFNGESGDAITRGEGHEQGDQMQLLYHVDDVSYLVDSGYDDGFWGSTWNAYPHHNVLTLPVAYCGGVRCMYYSADGARAHSEHQPVQNLRHTSLGRVDVLRGNIILEDKNTFPETVFPIADYWRSVLFVNDPARPYLIDINAGANRSSANTINMAYHLNTPAPPLSRSDAATGTRYFLAQDLYSNAGDDTRTASDLVVQPFAVEQAQSTLQLATNLDDSREMNGNPRTINRLDIFTSTSPMVLTTVSFVEPFPGGFTTPLLAKPGGQTSTQWQSFVRRIDANTLDVLAARSASTYRAPVRFQDVPFTVAEAGGMQLYLRGGYDFGFTRLRLQNGAWRMDTGYTVDLHTTATPRPSVPTNVVVSNWGELGEHPVITWDPATGASSYSVQRCTLPLGSSQSSCTSWSEIGTTDAMTYTYTDTGVWQKPDGNCHVASDDDRYFYRVVARNTSGNSDPSATANTCANSSGPGSYLKADSALPTEYALHGARPNPTRHRTTIPYDLPEAADVTLTLYDVLGREVARPVAGRREAGFHEAALDAARLPAGVYVCRLVAGDFTATRTLVVVH